MAKGSEIEDRQTEQATATNRWTLANGLTLIVRERYSAPLIGLALRLRIDEPELSLKRLLLARLAGNLLLREPALDSGKSLLTRWSALGAVISTDVRGDAWVLELSLPREQIVPIFEGLAGLFQPRSFTAAQLSRQCAVLEALLRDFPADPYWSVFRADLEGSPVNLGPEREDPVKVLREIKPEELREFIQKNHRARFTTLSLVGAANAVNVLELAQRLADDPPLEPTAESAKPRVPAEEPAAEKQETSPLAQPAEAGSGAQLPPLKIIGFRRALGAGPLALVRAGFRLADPMDPKEITGIDMLGSGLVQGRGSRLSHALREAGLAVIGLSIRLEACGKIRWLVSQWTIDPSDVETSERIFFQQVDRLRRDVVSAGEFQRIQNYTELRRRISLEPWSKEALELAEQQQGLGDYRRAGAWLNHLRAYTPQDLQRLAVRVFQYPNIAVEEIRPDVPPPLSAEDFAARVVVMAPGLREQQVEPAAVKPADLWPVIEQGQSRGAESWEGGVLLSLQPEPVRDLSVLSGPRAFVREDHSTPVLRVGLLFQGGRLLEDSASRGLTELMLRGLLRGVNSKWFTNAAGGQQLLGRDLVSKLEQFGAEVEIVNEPDYFGLVATTLARNQERVTRLMVDMLERPILDGRELARERNQQLLELSHTSGESRVQSLQHALHVLLGGHAYATERLGSRDSVAKLTAGQVKELYQQSIAHQYPLAILVGDTDGSALVSAVLAREVKRTELDKSFKAPVFSPAMAVRVETENGRGAMSHQTLLIPGAPGEHEDRLPLAVAAAALFGPGGVVQSRIREQLGLWCEMRKAYRTTLLPGALVVDFAHAPGMEEKVRSVTESEIARVGEQGLTDEEFRLARDASAGETLVRGTNACWRLRRYAEAVLYGANVSDVDQILEKITGLTAEKVLPVLRKYLKSDRHAWGVVTGVL
ncbi:MAG: insulinase family protein [Acidobacteria bacterium]|nr:insulinase family protein [Acidobacteriota bacterium]